MSATEKYILLITQFVTGKLTAPQFEVGYLDIFKNESEMLPQTSYDALNELFLDVDAYCNDPGLRDEEDLDDCELLESAKKALAKLV
ncbi:colicin immunity domain-containing protein [Salinicola socius]|uniref:colicin immunity domain-containing protein n=1 Tax=Salinicola socius TaxID=404433 RepID=UPI000DA1844B|nr:colicin immunity domain-containing protein [Salinicola socius]